MVNTQTIFCEGKTSHFGRLHCVLISRIFKGRGLAKFFFLIDIKCGATPPSPHRQKIFKDILCLDAGWEICRYGNMQSLCAMTKLVGIRGCYRTLSLSLCVRVSHINNKVQSVWIKLKFPASPPFPPTY